MDRTALGPPRPRVHGTTARAEALKISPPPRADLYLEDETELALLPTLTRCWMRRGHQRKSPAPGKHRKRHLCAAVDWREGRLLRRYTDRRDAVTFCALCDALVRRSRARGRRAVVLVDNARFHRPEKSREVAKLLRRHGRWLQLVYLPAYSPEDQPLDHLFRVLRGRVTHNHHRVALNALQADAEEFLHELDRDPLHVLRIIGSPFARPLRRRAAKAA